MTPSLFDIPDSPSVPKARKRVQEPPTPLGVTFDPALDGKRLGRQYAAVWEVVRDGEWWTLAGIHAATGEPEASVSARLRDMRRAGHTVERSRVKRGGSWGQWEYRVEAR